MVELVEPPKLNEQADDVMPGIRARFAEGRQASGLTLKDVAAGAGVSFVVVSQFERGVSSLSLPVFLRCCAMLHLRTEYVLHGRGKLFEGGPPAANRARKAQRAK